MVRLIASHNPHLLAHLSKGDASSNLVVPCMSTLSPLSQSVSPLSDSGSFLGYRLMDTRCAEHAVRSSADTALLGVRPEDDSLDPVHAISQRFVLEAFGSPFPRRRFELAAAALSVLACDVDARMLLIEGGLASGKISTTSACILYRQARCAMVEYLNGTPEHSVRWNSKRRLGSWPAVRGILRCMRAEAQCQMQLQNYTESIKVLQEILENDPADGLGVRHLLLLAQLTIGDLQGAQQTIDRKWEAADGSSWSTDTISICFCYTRALLAYHNSTPTRASLLQYAIKRDRDRQFANILAGICVLPHVPRVWCELGGAGEVDSYAFSFLKFWCSQDAKHRVCSEAECGVVAWVLDAVALDATKRSQLDSVLPVVCSLYNSENFAAAIAGTDRVFTELPDSSHLLELHVIKLHSYSKLLESSSTDEDRELMQEMVAECVAGLGDKADKLLQTRTRLLSARNDSVMAMTRVKLCWLLDSVMHVACKFRLGHHLWDASCKLASVLPPDTATILIDCARVFVLETFQRTDSIECSNIDTPSVANLPVLCVTNALHFKARSVGPSDRAQTTLRLFYQSLSNWQRTRLRNIKWVEVLTVAALAQTDPTNALAPSATVQQLKRSGLVEISIALVDECLEWPPANLECETDLAQVAEGIHKHAQSLGATSCADNTWLQAAFLNQLSRALQAHLILASNEPSRIDSFNGVCFSALPPRAPDTLSIPMTDRCARCGRTENLKTCAGCKKVAYCSVACQKEHWKSVHKSQCRPMDSR